MKKRIFIMILIASLVLCLLPGCSNTNSTPSASETYASPTSTEPDASETVSPSETEEFVNVLEGKTIEWYTPNPAGDLFDTAVRLYQPYLQEALDIKVRVINRGGSGGINAYNAAYNADEVTILSGLVSAMFALQYISKDEAVRYDLREFKWLGYSDDAVRVVVTGSTTGYTSIYDVLDAIAAGDKVTIGTYAKGGTAWNEAVALDYSLGLNSKMVAGYNSSTLLLSVLQGEVDFTCGSYSNYLTNIESGEMVPLLVLEETRSADCPDVPTVYEILDELNKSVEDMAMVIAMLDAVTLPKLTAASPNTTDEEWASLQKGFNGVMTNKECMDIAKGYGLNIPTTTGYEIEEMIREFIDDFEANGDDVVAIFKQYLDSN